MRYTPSAGQTQMPFTDATVCATFKTVSDGHQSQGGASFATSDSRRRQKACSKPPYVAIVGAKQKTSSAISEQFKASSSVASTSACTSGHSQVSSSGIMGFPTSYITGRWLGSGSFGLVTEGRCRDTGEKVAIKRVLQDPRYKNRELDVMKELYHPNIVTLKDFFYTEHSPERSQKDTAGENVTEVQRYLNVVMEYIPDTVHRVMKAYAKKKQLLPSLLVRLYTYQMCRSLGYLHSLGICHRDVKPQNLLVDACTHVLKLCDFGSAKRLQQEEPSVAYICSRFYRAPELMLGATKYTTAIDIWSVGCVLGELLTGKPLFAGDTSVDQLVKIIHVLGTPTRNEMEAMNPNYVEFKFPNVEQKDWKYVIREALNNVSSNDMSEPCLNSAVDLLAAFLKYEPSERLSPYEGLAHPFFDPLRDPKCVLPDGSPLPELFNFTEHELRAMSPHAKSIAVPQWWRVHQEAAASLSARSNIALKPACASNHTPSLSGSLNHQPSAFFSSEAKILKDRGPPVLATPTVRVPIHHYANNQSLSRLKL